MQQGSLLFIAAAARGGH